MRKTKLTFVAALCMAFAISGFAACGGEENVSGSEAASGNSQSVEPMSKTVTLSESSKTLDGYESCTLTATVTDPDGNVLDEKVEWNVEGTAVTVKDGVVQAQGVSGTAVVTATAGNESASCTVTVEDSGALPVLNVSDKSLSLMTGKEYTLTSALTYKRTEQTDATISYTIADPSIATIDANGKIKALAYGTTEITVKADWRGLNSAFLTETVTLEVKENVVVAITTAETTIYISSLTQDGQSFSNTTTYAGRVEISGTSDGVDASRIKWISSAPDIASVDPVSGVIVANAEKKEGSADITLSYETDNETYYSVPVKVNVSYPVIDKTESVMLDLETYNRSTVGEQLTAETVFGVGTTKTVTRIAEAADSATDISADTKWLGETDAGSEQDRTVALLVYNDEYAYKINVLVVTKIISSYEQLLNLYTYAGGKEVALGDSYGTVWYNYAGYFVLGNDIVVTASDEVCNAKSIGAMSSQSQIVSGNGFTGVFDGRGHSVVGLRTGTGGLFGDIGNGAVVKNLALVNAEITKADAGVLGFTFVGGTLDNVFVSYTATFNRTGVIGHYVKGGTFKNTVIYYNNENSGTLRGALTDWTGGALTVSNVYVIYAAGTEENNRVLVGEKQSISGTVTEISEEEIASASFSGLDDTYWTTVVDGGIKIFKSAVRGMFISKAEYSAEEGTSVSLEAGITDIAGNLLPGLPSISWTSSDNTVATVENGVVALLKEGSATITATCGDKSVQCVITVEKKTIEIVDKTSVTLDIEALSQDTLAAQTIARATENGLFEAFEADRIIIEGNDENINTSAWLTANDVGNEATRTKTIVVYGETVAYRVKILIITKAISTYEELTKMQEYGGVQEAVTANNTYYNYAGYFVLSDNIIVGSSDAAFAAKSIGALSSGGHIVATNGFTGTFDGRGYSIVGLNTGAGGLFGDIGKGGTVKNLAVVNAVLTEEASANAGAGVLCYSFVGGTVEDMFVSYTTKKARNGVFGRATSGGNIKNLVVYYQYSAGYSGAALTSWNVSASTLQNVYVVYAKGMDDKYCITTGAGNSYDSVAVCVKEENISTATFEGLTSDCWTRFSDSIPVFASSLGELRISDGALTATVGLTDTLTAEYSDIAGNPLPGITFAWNSSDSTVVSVENGELTFLKEGEAIVGVTCGGKTVQCTVTVEKAEIVIEDKTSVTLDVEVKGGASLESQILAEATEKGLFGAFDVTKVVAENDLETALVSADYLTAADTGNEAARTRTLVVYGETVAYKVKVLIVTKVISTYEELTKMQEYGGVQEVETANNTYYNYAGYFILGNNVVVGDADAVMAAKSIGALSSGGHIVATNGFTGVFDGRGYSVCNLTVGIGGLFGDIGKGAIVKNVALINVTSTGTTGGTGTLCFSFVQATIDNVYVSYATTANVGYQGALCGRATSGGTIKNTVVYYSYVKGYTNGAISSWKVSATTYSNVSVVYANGTAASACLIYGATANYSDSNLKEYYEQTDGTVKAITKTLSDDSKTITSLTESEIAADAFGDYDSAYWTVESGRYPVFNSSETTEN